MKRELVIAEPQVDEVAAAWIRANVLSRTPSTRKGRRWEGPDLGGPDHDPFALIDMCRCQWGLCGRCQDLNQHEECAHRTGTSPACGGTETSLISYRHGGAALAPVWVRQVYDGLWKGCRWVCPCEACERMGFFRDIAPHLPKIAPKRWKGTVEVAMF